MPQPGLRARALAPQRRCRSRLAATLASLLLPACQSVPAAPDAERAARCEPALDQAIIHSAGQEQVAHLERQLALLRADLLQAEEFMVAIESGLRGLHTRADAVSSLAEARIAVERASSAARWRRDEVEEAQAKLAEAERQLEAGHAGSAVFFASRARRIADTLNEEAAHVARNSSTRFVNTRHANLREGPSTHHEVVDVLGEDTPVFPEREQAGWILVRTLSGPAGWVHVSLLNPR